MAQREHSDPAASNSRQGGRCCWRAVGAAGGAALVVNLWLASTVLLVVGATAYRAVPATLLRDANLHRPRFRRRRVLRQRVQRVFHQRYSLHSTCDRVWGADWSESATSPSPPPRPLTPPKWLAAFRNPTESKICSSRSANNPPPSPSTSQTAGIPETSYGVNTPWRPSRFLGYSPSTKTEL